MKQRRCLTPEEYAISRKVSIRTVYRLIQRRNIPAERVGRQWRIWVIAQECPEPERTAQDTTAKV